MPHSIDPRIRRAERFGRVALALFGCVWCSFVLVFDGAIGRGMWRQARAVSFPTTQGIVLASSIAVTPGTRSSTQLKLSYSYTVAGQRYVGDKVSDELMPGRSQARLAAVYPVGAVVTVHYDPAEPTAAILRPGLTTSDACVCVLLTPFNVIVLAFVSWPWLAIRRRLGRLPPYGWLARAGADRVVLRLAGYGPTVAALGAMGLAAFVMAFLGFGFSMAPPLGVMAAAAALIVAAGVVSGVFWRRRLASGRFDLDIDSARGRVIFPGKVRVEAPLADVRKVWIRRRIVSRARSRSKMEVSIVAGLEGRARPIELVLANHPADNPEKIAAWLAGLLHTRVVDADE